MTYLFPFPEGVRLGGIETSTLRLARAMQRAGHDTRLLIHETSHGNHPALADMVACQPHEYLPAFTEEHQDQICGLYAAFPSAVFFPNQSAGVYSVLRRVKKEVAGLQIVGICHSDHEDYYQLAANVQDIVDVQFGVSARVCERLHEHHVACELLILGVEVPDVIPQREAGGALQLLYTGRLENYGKQCSLLIPAGIELARRKIPFRMSILGDGPYRKWLDDDLKQERFWRRRKYKIMEPVSPDELSAFYAAADVYLSFTRFEGNSISIMEALAYGCVPVVPRVSGTETMIDHRVTGWLGEVDNPTSLHDGCERLYREPSLRMEISQKAHEYAKRSCNISDTVTFMERKLPVT